MNTQPPLSDPDLQSMLKALPDHDPQHDLDRRIIQRLIHVASSGSKTEATTPEQRSDDSRGSETAKDPSASAPSTTGRGPVAGGASGLIAGLISGRRPVWVMGGALVLAALAWGTGLMIDTLFFAPDLAEVDLLSVMLFGAI